MEEDKKIQKPQKTVLEKYVDFAFVSSIIGLLTVGVCPAFGVIGMVIHCILKSKNMELSDEYKSKSRKAFIAGLVSLFFFLIDIIIALACMVVYNKSK